MIRFARIGGLAFKVVRLPRRELPPPARPSHVDHGQRVLFVADDLGDAGVRDLVRAVNGHPGGGPDGRDGRK